MTAAEVIAHLNLAPLPHEGGFFRETWRSSLTVPSGTWPQLYAAPRAGGTAIYAVLTPGDFSALHRLATDEVWHFYAGDALEMLNLHPDGSGRLLRLGPHFARGEHPQRVVPAGVWQGTRLAAGGTHGWALVGCTMAPAFAWEDFELGQRASLLAGHPAFTEAILRLTRA